MMTDAHTTTATGARFRLRAPSEDAASRISALDIAHQLAQINRFNGAACRPYSVAEHSLLVAEIMERHFGVRQSAALLAALLHDAHEIYCGDVTSPVKACLGYVWRELEDPLHAAVLHRYGVLQAGREWASVIKTCDLIALATERRALLPPATGPWPELAQVQPCEWAGLMDKGRVSYTWSDWRDVFIERFGDLHFGVHGDSLPLHGADTTRTPAQGLAQAGGA